MPDTDTQDKYTKFENIVILVALILGFVGSIILYMLHVKPILVSTFLGTGIASLIYRFLGGTSGNTMHLGALKLTGTVAVLIGSAYFINKELSRQESALNIKKVTFKPNTENWVALDLQGKPLDLHINETDQTITKKQESPWLNLPLNLTPEEGDKYKVLGSNDFELGIIDKTTLHEVNLFHLLEKSDLFVVTQRLAPFSPNVDLDPIPFKLSTLRYGGDYSRFQLSNKSDSVVWSGSIYRKRFDIIHLEGRDYFAGVVEVNHDFVTADSMYAKFAFAEILKR